MKPLLLCLEPRPAPRPVAPTLWACDCEERRIRSAVASSIGASDAAACAKAGLPKPSACNRSGASTWSCRIVRTKIVRRKNGSHRRLFTDKNREMADRASPPAEAILALTLRDPAEPIGLGEIRAATEALEQLVSKSLCQPRAVLLQSSPASIGNVAGPSSPRTSPVECLRLLAEVWRHPTLRGVVSQRFLTQELGALIRLIHEDAAAPLPGTRQVADGSLPPLEQPGKKHVGAATRPTSAASSVGATGDAEAFSGAAGGGCQPRDGARALGADAGACAGGAAISDAEWARERLACLLADELLVPLLESLIPLVRSADAPPWMRQHAARCLSEAVQRQGGAHALLLCLQDGGERQAASTPAGGGSAAQPALALAVALLSTPPHGTPADDYFRGMGAQAAELLGTPMQGRESGEAGAHYLRSAGAQLCGAIATRHPDLARRWLLAPLLAPLLHRSAAASRDSCAAGGSGDASAPEAARRLHALLCAAPPPPRLCDALVACGALTALLAPAPQRQRTAAREALSRLLLGATDPALALEAVLLEAAQGSAAHTRTDLLRRLRAEIRPPSLRPVAASLVVRLLRRAILATGAAEGTPAPQDLEWLHTCMVTARIPMPASRIAYAIPCQSRACCCLRHPAPATIPPPCTRSP